MFTGIIEDQGIIQNIEKSGTNLSFWIKSQISNELKVDQSLSHDGVCLTIEALEPNRHQVTAIAETLEKTNIGNWAPGHTVNLERCLMMNSRIDGHFVQGHVDCTAQCVAKTDLDGSWQYRFRIPKSFAALIVEKGSIALNGISLTIFDVTADEFSVAIIPYTYKNTSIFQVDLRAIVNIEFDLLGKYILRQQQTDQL
jgi:riboflavin synthase